MNKASFNALEKSYYQLSSQVEQLRVQLAEAQAMAGQWTPCVEDVDLESADGIEFHTMYCGTGLYVNDGECAMLPDGYAICKRNEGEYITVHRSYIENLEAKIAALSK